MLVSLLQMSCSQYNSSGFFGVETSLDLEAIDLETVDIEALALEAVDLENLNSGISSSVESSYHFSNYLDVPLLEVMSSEHAFEVFDVFALKAFDLEAFEVVEFEAFEPFDLEAFEALDFEVEAF
ncbi:hypothetical protein Tco_1047516 [Tanacetum coccineum]